MRRWGYLALALCACTSGAEPVGRAASAITIQSDYEEHATLTVSPSASNDELGVAVSLSGDTAVLGSLDSGAYVFARTGSVWVEQAKLVAPGASSTLGRVVSVSGDVVAVGGREEVVIFEREAGGWIEQATLAAPDAPADRRFGDAVAIEDDTLLVGAHWDDEQGVRAGAVYVFVRDPTGWVFDVKLAPDDATHQLLFGTAVAISGDTILVGASGDGGVQMRGGTAYAFTRNGATWLQQAKLAPADVEGGDQFGCSVALVGDDAAVGAKGDDDGGLDAGAAYVYVRAAGAWSETQKLTAPSPTPSDQFGLAVAISGDRLLVGSPYADGSVVNLGEAHLFKRALSGVWSAPAGGLRASDGGTGDQFGSAVAIDGATALVGARGHAQARGAAYVYRPGDADGTACDAHDTCQSGFCVDGFCCASACGGGAVDDCVACNVDGFEGECLPLSAGTSCGDTSDTPCSAPDTCDAFGTCMENHAAPTTVCRDRDGACDVAETCDGDGSCPADGVAPAGDLGAPSCDPYVCDGSGAECPAACVTDEDCVAERVCVGGACVPESSSSQGGGGGQAGDANMGGAGGDLPPGDGAPDGGESASDRPTEAATGGCSVSGPRHQRGGWWRLMALVALARVSVRRRHGWGRA